MQDTVLMSVNLTLKDIRFFVFGDYCNRIKVTFLIYAAAVLILFTAVLMRYLDFSTWLLFTVIMPATICLLLTFSLLPPIVRYAALASAYKNDKSNALIHWYELTNYVLKTSTESAAQIYHWNYIFKIEEYTAGFYIYPSPGSCLVLPKRCFTSQAQLDLFYALITANVEPAKLDLKKHRSAKPLPERASTAPPLEIKPLAVPPEPPLLAQISFKFTRAEFTANYLRHVYTTSLSRFIVIFGFEFLYFVLVFKNIATLLTWSLLGASVICLVPFILYFKTMRPIDKFNILETLIYTYRFYPGYMTFSTYNTANSRIPWDEIKFTETKSSYIINHKRTSHMIPKRTFDGKPEELAVFLGLVGRGRR